MLMPQMFGAGQWISCAYRQLSRFLHVSHIGQKFYNGMPYRYPQNEASTGISVWVTSIVTRTMASLNQMHRKGPPKPKPKKRTPMDGRPQLKGVVLKTLIKKPKKPNSANRKCVRLRLSTGKEVTAYIPGEGHNLQEHSIVLVRGGRVPDLPGVKLKCIRGKYDLAHVKK